MKKFYMVLCILKELDVEIDYGYKKDVVPLPVSQVFNGLCGVIPVFKTKKAAEKYAAGKFAVAALDTP